MLGDLGHDIESSILGIIDMNYNQGAPITRLNVKGLIHSDSSRRAIKPKMAYYAMQHVTALFDDSLRRIRELHHTYNAHAPIAAGEVKFNPGTDRGLSVYGYEKVGSGKQVFTIWMNEGLPVESNQTMDLRFTLLGTNIERPVYVDLLSGAVFEISANLIKREGNKLTIDKLPVYDSPILIADQSLVALR
jgi:hypothetical protein